MRLKTGLRPVEKSLFEKWGRRPSELFHIALKNVRRELKLEASRIDLRDGRKAIVLCSESEVTAACVYFFGAVRGMSGKLGTVFAMPHARCVVAHPVEDARDLDAVPRMLREAAGGLASAAELSSPDVYHWDGQRFCRIESVCAGEV